MRKEYLKGQLQTIKNNYAMVQLGILLMSDDDALLKFDHWMGVIGEHPEVSTFSYIRYIYDREDLFRHATKQFRNSMLRNCIKEVFEVVRVYAGTTNQEGVLRDAPWYPFLRMVRNSLSHDMRMRFTKYDMRMLPVSWSGLTISRVMDGQHLPMKGFLTREKAIELIDDVYRYVESDFS